MKNIIRTLRKAESELERQLSGIRGAITALSVNRERRKSYSHSAATRRKLSVSMKARWKAKAKAGKKN